MTTEVVNYHHLKDILPENSVYLGRTFRLNNKRLEGHKLANPFSIMKYKDRDVVIEMYREWLYDNIANGNITKEDILALKDKKLICFCSPEKCHCDVIVQAIEYFETGKSFIKFSWDRKIGYEVSSIGDKRFSAFNALLEDGQSIEYHYQVNVKGYNSIKEGKGRPPLKKVDDLYASYLNLWMDWSKNNTNILRELYSICSKKHNRILKDTFANTPVNQARALADVLNKLCKYEF